MEMLETCPICNQSDLRTTLSCRDYTASGETFNIQACSHCGFHLTNPRPLADELQRYYDSPSYISHSNTSANLIDKIYKLARTFTLRWKYKLVLRHASPKPATLLDYGCGTGYFLAYCKEHGLTVSGVEPNPQARAEAARQVGNNIYSDINEIKQPSDIITLWHVLEHVHNLHQTIQDLSGKLNPHGTLVIAVPNHNSRDAQDYQDYWAAYDVPRHLWHFSRSTMKRLLEQNHLTIKAVLPMPLDAYYVSLLSEKYRRGSHTIPGIIRAIRKGWISNRNASKTSEYSSLIYIATKQS